jgi:hypothetical protein
LRKHGTLFVDGRTKFGKRVKNLMAIAERYETERELAIKNSGLDAAIVDHYEAGLDPSKTG